MVYFLYYERIIIAEEDFLRNKFGEDFEIWASRTNCIIPNFRLWRTSVLPISYRNILKREYSGLFAVIVMFTLMKIIQNYELSKSLKLEQFWMGIFFAGLFQYVVLRSLKKYTSILHVDGR